MKKPLKTFHPSENVSDRSSLDVEMVEEYLNVLKHKYLNFLKRKMSLDSMWPGRRLLFIGEGKESKLHFMDALF